MIRSWDDVEGRRQERGHIAGTWRALTGDDSVTVGVRRVQVDPGMWSTPLHVENSEEEIFFVLGGSGISLQWDGATTEAFEVGEGDCLVHPAAEYGHTLKAGSDGIDVLAFGERHYAHGSTYLPRAGVSWGLGVWARAGDPDDHPWKREAEAGAPEVPELSPRPKRIVHVGDIEEEPLLRTTVRSTWRDIGKAAGSVRTGMSHVTIEPGALLAPPHSHSAEEEILIVLDGDGKLELWPDPRVGGESDVFELRAGSAVARPAGTGRAHGVEAGPNGMALLVYGTRDPNDICYYPRSGKVNIRGVGVIGRLEQLDYWAGEE